MHAQQLHTICTLNQKMHTICTLSADYLHTHPEDALYSYTIRTLPAHSPSRCSTGGPASHYLHTTRTLTQQMLDGRSGFTLSAHYPHTHPADARREVRLHTIRTLPAHYPHTHPADARREVRLHTIRTLSAHYPHTTRTLSAHSPSRCSTGQTCQNLTLLIPFTSSRRSRRAILTFSEPSWRCVPSRGSSSRIRGWLRWFSMTIHSPWA